MLYEKISVECCEGNNGQNMIIARILKNYGNGKLSQESVMLDRLTPEQMKEIEFSQFCLLN